MSIPELSEVRGITNVLLLAPSRSGEDDETCGTLLMPPDTSRTNVLSITISDPAEERLDVWRQHSDLEPKSAVVLSIPDSTGYPSPRNLERDHFHGGVTIDTLSNASDLTGLGIQVTKRLPELTREGVSTAVCFYSITALLQFTEPERAYQLIHLLTRLINVEGATGHFHMDVGAHTDQTINTFMSLFDSVVRFDQSGERTVQHRGREVETQPGHQSRNS